METYRTEEEKIEHLKAWWDENGKWIIGGVVISLSAVFGWQTWQAQQLTQAEQASDLYEQLTAVLLEDDDGERDEEFAIGIADELMRDFQSTAYPTLAALLLAKAAVENDDLSQAEKHLRWVLNNTDSNELKHITQLRLANILLAQGDLDSALSLLSAQVTDKFTSRYYELRGDILVQQGDLQAAKNSYTWALKDAGSGAPAIQMKLDDLGAGTD